MTGQLIARGPYPGPNGQPVWMLFGLVSVPDGTLKGETQYTVGMAPVLVNPVDVKEHTLGESPSGILCLPIWRV